MGLSGSNLEPTKSAWKKTQRLDGMGTAMDMVKVCQGPRHRMSRSRNPGLRCSTKSSCWQQPLEDRVRFDTLSVISLSLVSFPGIEASDISGMVTSAKLSQTQEPSMCSPTVLSKAVTSAISVKFAEISYFQCKSKKQRAIEDGVAVLIKIGGGLFVRRAPCTAYSNTLSPAYPLVNLHI